MCWTVRQVGIGETAFGPHRPELAAARASSRDETLNGAVDAARGHCTSGAECDREAEIDVRLRCRGTPAPLLIRLTYRIADLEGRSSERRHRIGVIRRQNLAVTAR